VAYCLDKGVDLSDLTIEELKGFSELIKDDIYDYITLEASVNSRKATGGTAKVSVEHQIKLGQEFLSEN
jgi:argininosuccinate lyase